MQCSPQPISTQLKTLSKYSLFNPTSSLSTSTITLLCTIETQAIRIFCLSHQGHTSPLKPKMHIEYFPYLEKIYKSQPPISTKCINFPIFLFILRGFLPNLRFFASLYFDHDAFLHNALHVLDAPDRMHHLQRH